MMRIPHPIVPPAATLRETATNIAHVVAHFMKAHAAILVPALCVLALLAIVAIPWIVIDLPEDYFCATEGEASPSIALASRIGKNIFGAIMLLIGLALFFPPGLGTVFMVAGIVLMDFPGKRRLERSAVKWRGVMPILNAIRRIGRVPPLKRP